MMTDVEADHLEDLIKEIAHKHGIAVSRDDPVLILQTLNKRLVADTAKAQEQALAQFRSEIEQISLTWSNDTKMKSERIINNSLSAAKTGMQESIEQGAKHALASLETGLKGSIKQAQAASNDAKKTATLSVVAAAMAIMASALAVISVAQF